MIALGDAAFREGRFVDALTRYREAANRSPNYAEAWFRKGHAYLANGQYQLAANAFREGYKIEPDGTRDGFRLKNIYSKDEVFKRHLESLAAVALSDSRNADSHYLLGVLLRYNGESERAAKFFAAAAKIESEFRSPTTMPGAKVLRLAESTRSDYEI
jgi:tetratricopeptide (TPR) repeat protein